MNVVRNILSDLVEKRLWPVAVLLVAALVALPLMLSRPGAPVATVVAPPAIKSEDEGPSLALTRSALTGFARSPRVNDKRLDPFGARYSKAFGAALARYIIATELVMDAGSGGGTTVDSSGGSYGGTEPVSPSGGGGGGGGGGSSKPEKTPKPQATPKPETERDDVLSILFAPEGSDAPKEITDIRTLSPLPDTEAPFLVYVGKTKDDNATFLVSADATFTGGGSCSPSPTDCRTLVMKVGDTATFTYPGKDGATAKASITVTDLETKNVVVSGNADTEAAAGAEADTRALGARALKTVIRDDDVLHTLVSRGVVIRH